MAEKRKLTYKALASLKPAHPGQRYELMDSVTRGFGVRIYDSGRKSFFLVTRYPGSPNPTRRSLGEYPTYSLAEAREKAEQWRKLIRDGKDPKAEEERSRRAELRSAESNFARVAEEYIRLRVKNHRQHADAERSIRKYLVGRWGDRDIGDIARENVVDLVEDIGDSAPAMARNVFGHARTLFNWAINRGKYGLETSPCDRVRLAELIGERELRKRVLSDTELKALWDASASLGYPFRDVYRLLMLTGARKNEVAGARWREIDLDKRIWTVPHERFKSNVQHIVPLSGVVMELLNGLPRFTVDHLFSSSHGRNPVLDFDRPKKRADLLMAEILGHQPAPWVVHDIRRTVRTRLSSLRVPDRVAELIIGHGGKGLQRVYDQHSYEPEMREALELWANRLHDILS
jgi:integrase